MARRRQDPDRIEFEGTPPLVALPMKERGTDAQGRRYWRARTRTGKRSTVWSGWGTRDEVVAEVGALLRKGIPSPEHGASGPVRTAGDLLRRWLAAQEKRHKANDLADLSIKNYRNCVSHWLGAIDDLRVAAVTRPGIEDQLTEWLALGVSARSCRHALDILTAAWKWGHDRELVPRLDLGRMSIATPREDEHVYEARTPTRDEVARVVAQTDVGRDRDFVLLLALTGARVGEVGALTVGSVDLAERVLVISGRDARRGRRGKVASRRWPIVGELATLLARLVAGRERTEPLIADLPGNVACCSRGILLRACEVAQVPRFTAHGLRRMVAMELLESADPKSVSMLTGHSVAVLLRDYVRPRAASLRDLVTRAGVGCVEHRGTVRALRALGSDTGADE